MEQRNDSAQVPGHGLLSGYQVNAPVFDFVPFLVDIIVPEYHLLGLFQVPPFQGVYRAHGSLLDNFGQSNHLLLELPQLAVQV